MGCIDGGFTVYANDVDRPFGETVPRVPKDKGCLDQVERGNLVRDIHDHRTGQLTVNGTLYGGQVVILQTPVAGKCDNWHEVKNSVVLSIQN